MRPPQARWFGAVWLAILLSLAPPTVAYDLDSPSIITKTPTIIY